MPARLDGVEESTNDRGMKDSRSPLALVAFALSTIFSPFVVFALLIILFVRREAAVTQHFYYWSVVALVVTAAIPLVYILWQFYRGRIADIHIERREQRMGVFLVFIFSILAGTITLWWLGAPQTFILLTVLIFCSALLAGIITLFWKISIHSWVIAGAITIYSLLVGNNLWLWWLAAVVPPVIWSRVYRGRHSIWQGMAGALAGILVTLILYHLLLR